ncbi:HAD-IA family hydrolase [Myxococcota bacterium]|nr:HAD-IA family hydrolase [Myxococcota bacterium]
MRIGIELSLQYLLWDHDGVLVDTERWYFQATREILARIDIALTQETYLDLVTSGTTCWDLARERGHTDSEIRLRRDERNLLYQDFLRTKPIEIDGISDVLSALGKRYRMGIVTTARRVDFELIHSSRDLVRNFEFVLTVEDYERSKPAPDPYLAGLSRFGANPDEALALEDSARGLASANAAGIECLVIRTPFTEAQDFSRAWRVVDSAGEALSLLTTE